MDDDPVIIQHSIKTYYLINMRSKIIDHKMQYNRKNLFSYYQSGYANIVIIINVLYIYFIYILMGYPVK